jgi:hypothetical protein
MARLEEAELARSGPLKGFRPHDLRVLCQVAGLGLALAVAMVLAALPLKGGPPAAGAADDGG